MIINNESLKANTIIKLLTEQDEAIQSQKKLLNQRESEVESLKFEISYRKNSFSKLYNDLAAIGYEYESKFSDTQRKIGQEKVELTSDENWSLSADFTFKIISENQDPNGMSVKSIGEKYKDKGIKCHDRQIFGQVEALILEEKVYQTNPEQKRGRKYRALS
jgi:hypothetical protein